MEIPGVVPFVGFVGLSVPRFEAHFTPCVEIGWRLSPEHWGRGYATEAARAALVFGFETLQLDEIVSFTVPENLRSRRVMEKIGMSHSPADDFDHPALPEDTRYGDTCCIELRILQCPGQCSRHTPCAVRRIELVAHRLNRLKATAHGVCLLLLATPFVALFSGTVRKPHCRASSWLYCLPSVRAVTALASS